MGGLIMPCEAHAEFVKAVSFDSAMPLLKRCPDCVTVGRAD